MAGLLCYECSLVLRDRLKGEKAEREFLKEKIPMAISQSQEGIRRITKNSSAMKNFSHPSSGELAMSDINRGILSTVTVTAHEWKYIANMELLIEWLMTTHTIYRGLASLY